MTRKSFIITVDTEADNQWDHSRGISTENALFIPRFQELAERYGFVPTWLTNYEMALDDRFADYVRPKAESGKCEIGMHLHAWNSPPDFELPAVTDNRSYLIEYPEDVMRAKVIYLHALLEERFGMPIRSHRSGRWAMDSRYAKALVDVGITVDCSTTPGVDWAPSLGQTGVPGTDYSGAPMLPYWLREGLLEVPMTIRKMHFLVCGRDRGPVGMAKAFAKAIIGRPFWLRPDGDCSARKLLAVLARAGGYAMFMIYSSELMPGGSPTFPDEESIERLYRAVERVFEKAAEMGFEGEGLTDFAERHVARVRSASFDSDMDGS